MREYIQAAQVMDFVVVADGSNYVLQAIETTAVKGGYPLLYLKRRNLVREDRFSHMNFLFKLIIPLDAVRRKRTP